MLTNSTSHAVLNISPSRLLSCPHNRVSLPIAPCCCMFVVLVPGAVPAAGKQKPNLTNLSCSPGPTAHSTASTNVSLIYHQQLVHHQICLPATDTGLRQHDIDPALPICLFENPEPERWLLLM